MEKRFKKSGQSAVGLEKRDSQALEFRPVFPVPASERNSSSKKFFILP